MRWGRPRGPAPLRPLALGAIALLLLLLLLLLLTDGGPPPHAAALLHQNPPLAIRRPSTAAGWAPRRLALRATPSGDPPETPLPGPEQRPSALDDLRALYGLVARRARDDPDTPEAQDVVRLEAAGRAGDTAAATLRYLGAKLRRAPQSPEFRRLIPQFVGLFNVAFLLILLRVSLPRLLAMQSMGDLGEVAQSLGLPGRAELLGYVEQVGGYSFWVKVAVYQGLFLAEKVLMVTEFLPLGIILPAISPVVFGGVWEGAVITAICSMNGATANFLLGREFLAERVQNATIFGSLPVKDTGWFRSLCSGIRTDGFKIALLLRLAPILPIPFDAHWYVCGITPMRLVEFMPAQFLGAFKVAFVDAFLGDLLVKSAVDAGALDTSRTLIIAETVGLLLLTVVVTSVATDTFTKLLAREGWDAAPPK